MKRAAIVITSVLVLLSLVVPVAAGPGKSFPDVVDLPVGFQPEGIAIGKGHTFYTGSLAGGAIYAGDLRTGEGDILAPGADGRLSVGMDFDERSGNLFVAGGLEGTARVYNTRNGAVLATYQLTAGGPFGTFVNDVIVTREAAYFTDSFQPLLYRLPLGPGGALPDQADVEVIALGGNWMQQPGFFVFNANGIEATSNGKTLIVVNSTLGTLYRVDSASGVATLIDLGGDTVSSGDGLLLEGKTLYVVQNVLNQIAVVRLTSDLSAGTISDVITSPAFDVPTTVDRFGSSLYLPNAKFGVPEADRPTTPYEIVKVSKR